VKVSKPVKLFCIFIACSLGQCKKKEIYFLPVPDTGEPPAVDIAIKNFTAEGYKDKALNWTLQSDTSYINYTNSEVVMKKIVMTYYESPGESSLVTCDEALMNRLTNDMSLKGEVRVKSSNGRQLYSDILYWDSKKEELSTNVPVKIIYKDGEVITGRGLKANGSLSKIVIYQPVGIHTIKDEK